MVIRRRIDSLARELRNVRNEMLALERRVLPGCEIHPTLTDSARNLVHYLALRRRDLRSIQAELADLGLSSLGRAEPHVLSNVDTVLRLLGYAAGHAPQVAPADHAVSLAEGHALLDVHARALLGDPPSGRHVRIMVTLPTEAADDRDLVRSLVESGMDCVRINCAHDGPAVWLRMIENLRSVERETGGRRPVAMDLAGPKLRTGPIVPGPEVLKISPKRDELGFVVRPAVVWLCPEGRERASLPSGASAALPVPADWLDRLSGGETVSFEDTRGARRSLVVGGHALDGWLASCSRTAYIASGTQLLRGGDAARISSIPPREGRIRLRAGDTLIVTRDPAPGIDAVRSDDGTLVRPATVSCTLPQVFDRIRVGASVFLDDGKIGGIVRFAEPDCFHLEVTRASDAGAWLGADKGINFPDSDLGLPALTEKDLSDLEFVAAHADIVDASFVNEPSDVDALTDWIETHDARHLGVVLKIETKRAFENLPGILLAAMRAPRRGIMIARGDLAVECGFERMAEVQEEMLWLCEAAHIPIIWATQVLETVAKKGAPSRAEITDAAFSNRAECVMLNKGPYVSRAVRVLDDILRRMATHQNKKVPIMGRLNVARRPSTTLAHV